MFKYQKVKSDVSHKDRLKCMITQKKKKRLKRNEGINFNAIGPEIREGPASISVPVGNLVTFECRAYCDERCGINWHIGGRSTAHSFQREQFLEKGFVFSDLIEPPTYGSGIYTSRLSVNASVHVNNTNIYCTVEIDLERSTLRSVSDTAVLLVVSGK